MRYLKAQAAMEYLMTYGWSVAVAVSVLSALFALGLFTRSTVTQSVCVPVPGYKCQTPVLATNGMLEITFAQSIGTIDIINTGCTRNMTPPTTLDPMFATVVSGTEIQISFLCPLTANTLSSQFTGYLWISYNTITESELETEFASITTMVKRTV